MRGTKEDIAIGDVLEDLGHRYRHLRAGHGHGRPTSASRRHLEEEMHDLAGRFERAVEQWIPDQALSQAWRRYLYEGGPRPEAPIVGPARLFKGASDWGGDVEIRASTDRTARRTYDIVGDGATLRHEELPWEREPDPRSPVQVHEHSYREVFEAAPEAVEALADFLARPRTTPPRRWFRELFEDGLIDRNWGLTARGQRLLGRSAEHGARAARAAQFVVVVADGSRARVLTLASSTGASAPTPDALIEVAQTINPEGRAKDREIHSDSRPRRRGIAAGSIHGVEDNRDGHHAQVERRFALQIVSDAAKVWRRFRRADVIIAASPSLLGQLRPALRRFERDGAMYPRHDLARDLSWLSPAQIHDALAEEGLLPPRGRMPARVTRGRS